MNRDYLVWYRALEVEPGCSWTQLRSSYQQLVRTWHPDRFCQQPEKKALAEERIKEINQAYHVLSAYRERYGNLPAANSRPDRHSRDGTPGEHPSRAPSAVLTDSDWSSPRPPGPAAKPAHLLRLLLIGLASWAAYTLWWPHPPAAVPRPGPSLAGRHRTAKAGLVSASVNDPARNRGFFTVGSTRDEVQTVQGIPTSIRNGVWYYGKSRVYFLDGTVMRWVNDPADPLRIAFSVPKTPRRPTTFTIGSTKTLVKSVQGRPLLKTAHEWDYGVSKVYFADGRVTGWYNSPFSPLNAARSAP
ncbi:MAG: J domain-containing protein [Acidiferrobacterales bacterium]